MKKRKSWLILSALILIMILAGSAGYYFYNQSTQFVKSDDAKITGQQIVIAAPVAGRLVAWNGAVGTRFKSEDLVGMIQPSGNNTAQSINIQMPQQGTIIQNNTAKNENVAFATPLAYAYNLNKLEVTANIDETNIQNVKVGNTVDVFLNADPGKSIKGTVSQIGYATASAFSLLPSQSTNDNYTKVTQVIPVTIQLENVPDGLVPGMNATVQIHR